MSLPRMINDQPDNPRLVSFSKSLALVLQLLPSSAPGDVVMCRCRLTVGVSRTSRRHHCLHLHCFLRHQVTVVVRACSPSSSSWHRDTRPRSSHHRPHALLSSHRQRCPYKPRHRRRPTSTTSSCCHQVALVRAGARCECGCGWTCMCRHRLTICIGPTSSSSSLRTALQPLPHVVAKSLLSPVRGHHCCHLGTSTCSLRCRPHVSSSHCQRFPHIFVVITVTCLSRSFPATMPGICCAAGKRR